MTLGRGVTRPQAMLHGCSVGDGAPTGINSDLNGGIGAR
jgi:hypothetical protein